jgi:hypothetical protein
MSNKPLNWSAAAEDLGLYDPPTDDKTHYEALGRFLSSFANAEGAVHSIARKLSELSDEKARILFGGMRLADVIDRIKGFIQLSTADKSKEPDQVFADLEACLEQLAHIAQRRHNIVHRGATYFGGAFVVSNSMIAKTLAGIESEIISQKTLNQMYLDCGAIFLRLIYFLDPATKNDGWLDTLRRRSWLYIPPTPNSKNPQHRKDSESPKRQPRASRASRRREAIKNREE